LEPRANHRLSAANAEEAGYGSCVGGRAAEGNGGEFNRRLPDQESSAPEKPKSTASCRESAGYDKRRSLVDSDWGREFAWRSGRRR
jgi:hypothetical protein